MGVGPPSKVASISHSKADRHARDVGVQQAYRPIHSDEEQVLAAMKVRMGRVALVAEITPLPKNGRDRETSARFSKQSDGWLTSIRYGQMPIPVGEGGQADILIGARNIWRRSDAVAAAICQA